MKKSKGEDLVNLQMTGSVTYQAQVTEALAAQIISICAAGSSSVSLSPSASPSRSAEDFSARESIAEYIIRVGARRNADKILAIANYLQEKHGKASVSPQEIKIQFRDAGETPPANFTRDFNDVASSGWLAPEPNKKGYYWVTRTGKEVIEQSFEKARVKRSNKTRSRTRRRSSGKDNV